MATPASGEWLAGRVTTLRRHFSASLADDRHEEAMMEDWLDALEPFPQFAVEAACADYLRSETFPPRPAAICQRAAAVMGDLRKRMADAAKPRLAPAVEISEDERKRRSQVLSDLARELQGKAREGFGGSTG